MLVALIFCANGQVKTAVYYTPTTLINGDQTLSLELGLGTYPRSRFMFTTKFRRGFVNRFGRFDVPNNNFRKVFDFDEITRIGMRIDHRIHLKLEEESNKKNSTFFSYGFGYSRTDISYSMFERIFNANGTVVGEEISPFEYNINTVEALLLLGKQFYWGDRIIVEAFGGIRAELSESESNSPVQLRDFRSGFLAPEYSGVAPVLGLRIGMFLSTKLTTK